MLCFPLACEHSLTLQFRYLVNHVAWSVDILFMNILQNKSSPKVVEDLKLLQRIVEFYEFYDKECNKSVAYKITKSMHTVASKAVQMAQDKGTVPSIGEQLSGLEINNSRSSSGAFSQYPFDAVVEGTNGFHINNINHSNGIPGVAGANNGFNSMPFLESEWMMPLGFQPEYWQDPWANVFQDPDVHDMA